MKKIEFKRLTALLLAVLLLVSLCPTQIFSVFAEELDASSTISVSMILTDKVTNSPVAGVSVQLGSETVTSDESGTAVFTVVPPAAEEQDMTYTVIATKEGYQPVNTSVKIPAGQTTGIETSISMVPVADLTVEVYYGGELLNDSVTVTLSSDDTQSTATTTNGVAVFPALSLIGNYQVSVQKPDSDSGMYYVAGTVNVTASGGSFDKVRLDVQKKNATDAIVSFSIEDADVSGSGVYLLKSETAVAGLCYDLDAMITAHAGFWKNLSDTFEIALTNNNSGAAFLSNKEGTPDPSGRYLTVTAVTESGAPIRVKVSEKASGAVIAEQEFAISVNKATPTVTYTVAGCPVEDNSTINFGKLGTSLIFAAEGDFKTEAPFSLNVPANDALKVDLEKNSVTNLKATLRADGEVMAIPVTFSRAADAWYQAASLSVKLQSCRDERPETGFGAVSYEDITVCMSDPKDFSVVPEIDSAGAPEDVQDSAAEITYELKDQTIYKMEDNTKVTNASVKLVTIGADGIAKINPEYYGTATLVATIKDTDCFLETEVSCTLTVQKDIVDNNEKPFTLTYTDDQGAEQTLSYTYSDGAFVAEGGWIAYQITLKPNTGYDVQISGESVPADGTKLAQGNVSTYLTFESGTYSSETVALNTRSDWTKPEVSYTFVSDAFKAFKDTVSMGIAVFSGDVTVQVDASDNEDGSGIQKVCVYVCDEERDVTEKRFTVISVSEMLNKTISVTAKAEDKAGNSAEAASPAELPNGSKPSPEKTFNIIGDVKPPQINVTYSCTPYSSVVPVYNNAGLAEVSVVITEENYDLTEKATFELEGPTKKSGQIENSGSTMLFAMDDLADGEYTLTITYSDVAGYPADFSFNRGESDNGVYTYSFRKDTTAPIVELTHGEANGKTDDKIDAYNTVPEIGIEITEQFYTVGERAITITRDGADYSADIGKEFKSTFKPTKNENGLYTITVSYTDAAGYFASASYTFLYNNSDPTILVELSEPIVDTSDADTFKGTPLLTITISDEYFDYAASHVSGSLTKNGEITNEFENKNSFSVENLEEGKYFLTISYSSAANKPASAANDTLGEVEKNTGTLTYTFYVDNKAPEITYSIDDEAGVSFLEVLTFGIIATSDNDFNVNVKANDGDFGSGIKSVDVEGQSLYTHDKEKNEAYLKSVDVSFTVTDKSALKATPKETVTIDAGTPVTAIVNATDFATNSSQKDRPKDYSKEEYNGKDFYVLSDQVAPMINVSLGTLYTYVDDSSLAIYSDVDAPENNSIDISVNEANYGRNGDYMSVLLNGEEKNSNMSDRVSIDIDKLPDGAYTLIITYADIAGNKAEYPVNLEYGTVDSENGSYTYYFIKDTKAPEITVTYNKQPIGSFPAEEEHDIPVFSNITNYNGYDYYGLPKIEVTLVEENYDLTDPVTVSYCDDANTNQSFELNKAGAIEPIAIDVSKIPDGAYNLAFAYTDIAGHTPNIEYSKYRFGNYDPESGSYSYEFIKDTTAPVCNGITLNGRQDTIGNMEFYQGKTSGTASVTEQFFNPAHYSLEANGKKADVSWTSYPQNPAIGGFEIKDDGHYTLVLTGSDDAKHAMATYTYPATVVLDSTPPVISMTTPPAVNEVNQNRYYNDGITCTIEIIERNFYNSGAVQITCTRNGESYPISGISWSGGGDIHNGTFGLTEEGEYRISISYSDPSKNASTYTCEYTIIIDKTAPTVSIIDAANKKLEDKSAYSSKAVSFTISLEDQNLRQEDILIELKGWIAKDDENGNLVLTEEDFSSYISDISVKEDGKSYQVEVRNLKDDAVYTLKVSGEDLSGNAFNESRVFSVNRDGSTYYIEGETAELVKQYYTNVAHTVEIHEVCAEELKTTDISISHNLDVEKYELEEETESNKHFDVTNAEDCKWNEYVYQVLNTNFVEQGSYSVATSSVAKTTGVKKSSSEVVAVNFLMDTTVPTVNVAGIKDGGRYQTNAQEITITCQDDQMLQHVEVWLDDTLLDEYDFEEEMLSSKDITVKIPGANEYREQKLRVVVQDKAGNAPTEILVGVYVSTSIWNLYRNYILIGGGILVAAIAAVIVLLKKRKNTK